MKNLVHLARRVKLSDFNAFAESKVKKEVVEKTARHIRSLFTSVNVEFAIDPAVESLENSVWIGFENRWHPISCLDLRVLLLEVCSECSELLSFIVLNNCQIALIREFIACEPKLLKSAFRKDVDDENELFSSFVEANNIVPCNDSFVRACVLYEKLKEFCKSKKIKTPSQRWLGLQFRKLGIRRVHTNAGRAWCVKFELD
jgi:hypothetical protein